MQAALPVPHLGRKKRGTLQVVRLTDSSAAGAEIRAGLSSCLPLDR